MRYVTPLWFILFFAIPTTLRADEWEHTYPVSGTPEIVVDTNDGDIEVVVGSSQQVVARVISHGWKINDDLRIQSNGTQSRVELRLHRQPRNCFGLCFQSIRVELRVPRESNLNVRSGDGTIRVDGVRGDHHLESNDGDLRLHDLEGSLRADTHDGTVKVSGRFDLLEVHTGDGDIDAEVSGSSEPKGSWSLRSGDGTVRLRLPGDFRADLDAKTGDGDIRVGFPMDGSEQKSEHAVRAKINGGGLPLELQTGDGNIRVEKM